MWRVIERGAFTGPIKQAILGNAKLSNAESLLGRISTELPLSTWVGSLPPILQAGFEQPASARSYIRDFETLTLAMRQRVFDVSGDDHSQTPAWANRTPIHQICAEDVQSGVIEAIEELAHPFASQNGAASLKLVGWRIQGDLDLSKLDIPFSVRLVGCYIDGALILDRTKLVTLDLSGTVIRSGISSNYIEIQGALRARRLVSTGPVDFGGASVNGSVDLSDAILYPENPPTHRASYVADRGILNFSLAKMVKDVRLSRIRLYGGLNIRGGEVGGMLHLNDAVLRCPVAHFELLLDSAIKRHRSEPQNIVEPIIPIATEASIGADVDIASKLHAYRGEDRSFANKVEVLGGDAIGDRIWTSAYAEGRIPEPFRLLQESPRLAESAIRAEGLKVGGPVYANSMRVSGRVRMKSLETGGGVSFNGSRFRTVRSIRADIKRRAENAGERLIPRITNEDMAIEQTPLFLLLMAQSNAAYGLSPNSIVFRKEYAVDLRDAKIGGPLDFSHDLRGDRIEKCCDARLMERIAEQLCATGEDVTKFISVFTSSKGGRHANHTLLSDQRLSRSMLDLARGEHQMEDGKLVPGRDPKIYAFEKMEKRLESRLKVSKKISKAVKDNPRSSPNRRSLAAQILDMRRARLAEHRADYPVGMPATQASICNQDDVVADAMKSLVRRDGILNSTILIGEIRLTNIHINGGLIFRDMIVSSFDSEQTSEMREGEEYQPLEPSRRILSMRNAIISGDLDFANSIGFQSINAKQVVVSGSIKFCDKPKYSSRRHRFRPLANRAFFPETKRDNVRLQFDRAKIGGNAVFLFDRESGPSVCLGSAEVGEELYLMPARFGVQLSVDDTRELFDESQSLRKKISSLKKKTEALLQRIVHSSRQYETQSPKRPAQRGRKLPFGSDLIRSLLSVFLPQRALEIRVRSKVLDLMDADVDRPHRLDLRGASAKELVHPPAAWPKRDGLLLTGFKYSRAHLIGPLAPIWWSWPRAFSEFQKHQSARIWHSLLWALFFTSLLTLGWMAVWVTSDVPGAAKWREHFGGMNTLFGLVLMFSLLLYAVANIRIGRSDSYRSGLAPLWLNLQRRHFNTNKVFADARPFEPYLRAARVLRSGGYSSAADYVEIARLRETCRNMSWRKSALPKVVLSMLDGFIGFGFRPVRAVLIFSSFLLCASLFFHQAERYCAIKSEKVQICQTDSEKRNADFVNQVVRPFVEQRAFRVVAALSDNFGRSESETDGFLPKNEHSFELETQDRFGRRFNSMWYTMEMFIPLEPILKEERWVLSPPSSRFVVDWWFHIALFIRLLGWVFVTLIVLAVAARIETLFARARLPD